LIILDVEIKWASRKRQGRGTPCDNQAGT